MAAAAESQLTGLPGVICVTAGPGSANAMSGVVEAWVDSASILVISGQVPSLESDNYGRSSAINRTFGIAGIPTIAYTKEFTKASISIDSAENLKGCLTRALFALVVGRKGPVWLDVPLDIQSAMIPDFSLVEVSESVSAMAEETHPRKLNFEDFSQIRELLLESKRPLILFGRGLEVIENKQQLFTSLKNLSIPFALSRVVSYTAPIELQNNLGVLGVRGRPWSKKVLESADLLVSFGCRFPSSIVGPNYSYLSPTSKLVMVDIDADELNRHGKRLTLSLNRDISNLTNFLSQDSINVSAEQLTWVQHCRDLKELEPNQHLIQDADQIFNLYWFMRELEKYATENTVLTSDAGSNYYATGQAVNFSKFKMEITSGTFAAMGLSLPLAIGASINLKKSGGIVFCVTGDGSIELNVQELQTLATYQLPVKVFIINNGGYASMRAWQDSFFESRYIGSTDDTGTKPLNFEKVAQAFDLSYECLRNPKELSSKIKGIIENPKPEIIEVICDPNQKLLLPMATDLV
jgi:acetolactate synthase-1/2/3 large subunit